VWSTEEKGSDVNLASHLLIDGFRARYWPDPLKSVRPV
jgi:hypothetical protein